MDHWGATLHATNSLGPFDWSVNGSAELLEIASRSFDEFGIPRWAQMRGLGGEVSRIETLVPSVNLMHAGVLLHSNAETAEAIPAAGLAATARAYAKIIVEANRLDLSDLPPPGRASSHERAGLISKLPSGAGMIVSGAGGR